MSTEQTFANISLNDLKKAIQTKSVILLDCNGGDSYHEGHIPTAISARTDGWEKNLPSDKSKLIVAYCGSEKCGAWKKGAEKAHDLGFTNVKHFSVGLKGWKAAGEELVK